MVSRNYRKGMQFTDTISHLYPELTERAKDAGYKRPLTQSLTFQVTDDCNLACTYCYQTCKGKRRMSFETAKKAVDMLLTGDKGMSEYINPISSPGVIIEFIGGEPFLEVELIQQIYEYFLDRAIELNHPWATLHRISICSNGILYFDPKVQEFLNKYKYNLSFSVTVDGNKELHDACRVFPDGRPSYDLAVAAAKDWMDKGGVMGSKITIAPGNVMHLYEALTHMVELGYDDINANCVYEKGWTTTHAVVLYAEMKRVADYFLDTDLNFLDGSFRCSLYENNFFHPKEENDLQNWCGGNGVMLSVDPDGVFYPCIRYMESSLNGEQEPYSIGNVDDGICAHDCEKCRVVALKKVDRRTQSTDECFNCPIAEGCSWCTAYNYQVFGTPDARATFICVMHKARTLGNIYFWNKYYRKHNMSTRMKMHIPDEWALEIISQSELDMLKELSKEDA